MDYTLEEHPDVMVVRFQGSLDAYLRDFTPEIEKKIRLQPRPLVANLSRIDFIGSRGMGLLFHLHKLLKDVGCDLVLADPSKPVTDALEIGGISNLLTVCGTEDEGVEAAKGS